MPVETIQVAFVNQPKPGKTFGSIKTADGTFYSVKPADLGQFTQGQTYSIEFDYDASGRYRNFKRIMKAATEKAQEDKGRDIFITGVVQQAMSTGKFEISDIKILALAARDAWAVVHEAAGDEPDYDDPRGPNDAPF